MPHRVAGEECVGATGRCQGVDRRVIAAVVAWSLGGCSSPPRDRPPPPRRDAGAAPPIAPATATGCDEARAEIAPGVVVQRIRAEIDPPLSIGDRCLLVVRIDPARHRFDLLAAGRDGQRKTVREWADAHDLIGVTNASMFHDSGQSTGLMIDGDQVNNGDDNGQFGAVFAFDPVAAADPAVAMFGRGCPGFDLGAIRARYRVVIQNYRLLGCAGEAVPWRDDKIYSAAAVGLDRQGQVVFALMRTPYRMTALSQILASPALDLAAAMYVEGGPEASLLVRGTGAEILAIGSYESLFKESDDNVSLWALPNVIGFRAAASAR